MQGVEILADDGRVIEHKTVIGGERRHLHQRVLARDVLVGLGRHDRGREALDTLGETRLQRHDHDFADVGGGG